MPGETHNKELNLFLFKIGLQVVHQFMGKNGIQRRCNHLPRIGDCQSGPPGPIIDGYNSSQNSHFACKDKKNRPVAGRSLYLNVTLILILLAASREESSIDCLFLLRSLTPPQAAGNALA